MTVERGGEWAAVARLEDKLTDWMDETRQVLREQQTLVSQLATRQAVIEERVRRTESDLTLTSDKATRAHDRIDTMATARSEDVGMRKGVVAGVTLASTVAGSGLVLSIAQLLGGG
jgi:outer membrane murein-binding lipoprotein Lpp